MRETEAAAIAFADYLALGATRSLESLAVRYESADSAPTRSLHTLKRWSEEHDWQARVDKHVAETNAAVLKRMQSDEAGLRVRRLRLVSKAIESIKAQVDRGTPVDPKELRGLIDTEFKLIGAPLADVHKHKVGQDPDAPPVFPSGVIDLRLILSDPAQREKVADLATDPEGTGAGEDLPGGSGEDPEPRPLEDGAAPGPAES